MIMGRANEKTVLLSNRVSRCGEARPGEIAVETPDALHEAP